MENPADDPREFSAHHPEDDVGPGGSPDEILRAQFIEQSLRREYPLNDRTVSLQTLLSRGFAERRRQQPNSSGVCNMLPSLPRGTNCERLHSSHFKCALAVEPEHLHLAVQIHSVLDLGPLAATRSLQQ